MDEQVDLGPPAVVETPVGTSSGAADPSFIIDPATGLLSIDWRGDRPDEVLVSADLVEGWLATHNALMKRVTELEGGGSDAGR